MRTSSVLLLVLAGCSENSLVSGNKDITDPDAGNAPDIEVSPPSIDFGSVAVGDPSVSEVVTVTNVGTAALQISDVSLEASDMPYTVSAIGSILLAPGDATTFTVTFEPTTAADWTTNVNITSNDPDEGVVPVALTATGIAPAIQVDPENYDFGSLFIGCVADAPITVTNVGNADLVISEFTYVTASVNEMTVVVDESVNGPLPWTLAPGASTVVNVEYGPFDEYDDEGYLTISSNDPLRPEAQAHQTASGELYGENLDLFEQPIRRSSDILFVIDNSCSMADEQANLAANVQVLAETLTAVEVDYHVAVITTDSPDFRGEILTPESSDIETEFVAQATPGIGGSGDERPTEMAYQSTQEGADAGPDGDFLREDALLSMIFVSDEPDSSPSTWSEYLTYFQSLKSDSDNFVAHAISGDYPSGCGSSSFTNNVYELTVATGGLFLSVCATDWAVYLEDLVNASVAFSSSFDLTQWPVPQTIEVQVDGVPTTTGWTYNSTDNSVDFDDDHIPIGGSTIEIQYALLGDCDG